MLGEVLAECVEEALPSGVVGAVLVAFWGGKEGVLEELDGEESAFSESPERSNIATGSVEEERAWRKR